MSVHLSHHSSPRGSAAAARPSLRPEFAAVTHPGKVRHRNEDHYLITRIARSFEAVETNMPAGSLPDSIKEVAHGMVVADGMGGMAAGEKASQLAIRTGVDLVLGSNEWYTSVADGAEDPFIDRMSDYLRKVDSVVVGEGRADRGLSGMGTTLTFAYIFGAKVYLFHIGDSRAYLLRRGTLKQLTRDHTMAQGLADAGAIRPEEVAQHAKRNVLTNFVGGPTRGVEPDILSVDLLADDVLMICSDGLTDLVADDEIRAVLRRPGPVRDAANALLQLALDRGGHDNITIVLARFGPDAPASP